MKEIYMEIMRMHYQKPFNKGLKNEGLIEDVNNPFCGDVAIIEMIIKENKIIDAYHEAKGCMVCQASASMLTQVIIGKTIKEVFNIVCEFKKMISKKAYDKKTLGILSELEKLSNNPSRAKCALLSFEAIEKIIGENYGKEKL